MRKVQYLEIQFSLSGLQCEPLSETEQQNLHCKYHKNVYKVKKVNYCCARARIEELRDFISSRFSNPLL